MNLSFIPRALGAAKLALKANAPTIMVVGGVTSMGVGTVLACRQTLYVESILINHVESLEKIETGEQLELEGYSPDMARQDRIKVYTRVSIDMAKHYAIPAGLFLGGAGLVFGGHRILLRRNATLALAFTGLKQAFDAYRQRVVEAYGPEVDHELSRSRTVRVEEIDDQGKVVSSSLIRSDIDPYNRVFEQGASESWRPDLGVNRMFLAQQQRYAQERLNRQGHLYLCDVYEALGFPESDISRVVGWKIRRNPDGSKDFPMVDFGLDKPHPDDDLYSQEKAIYLDFNCQGLIVGGKLQRLLEKA